MVRQIGWLSWMGCVLGGLSALPASAHESAQLRAPDGSESPRGEARIGGDEIRVRGDGLERGEAITIWIAGPDGILVQSFETTIESNGSFDVRDEVDDSSTFAGRALEVRGPDGAVRLVGSFPKVAEDVEAGTGVGELTPPEGVTDSAASGRIKVKARDGRHSIEIKVRGLQYYAVYTVFVLNGAGESEAIGKITGKGSGNGALKIDTEDGGSLPFGAAGIADLVGFPVQVKSEDGTVVLEGKIPALGDKDNHPEEAEQEVEFDLARPAGSGDADIEGDVNIEEEIGSDDKIRVRIKDGGDPNAVYLVTAHRPTEAPALEEIARITVDSRGRGETLRRGSGVFPLGARSLSELGGVVIQISTLSGSVVLSGAIPQVGDPPGPLPPAVERLKLVVALLRPEPAVDSDAHGKVELEEEDDEHEIEVELEDLQPGASYRVELHDPAGPAEAIAEAAADSLGNLRHKVSILGSERLPFDASSFKAYDGFSIVALDSSGSIVLRGEVTIPAGGGGALAAPVAFTMVGDYDAPFLRGDSDRSSEVNLTDAISTLHVLFLGKRFPACLDAMDANDDGAVDIADPIATLVQLFVGGVSIPFPGFQLGGFDPTADDLSCRDE